MPDDQEIVFCKGGGCTAKLGPGALASVLAELPKVSDPRLLVGFDSSDDAAVYQLSDDLAVVMTLDFFPPMVDDPYTFGQIAATNALSDVYAMGGDVLTALNIVCFPEKWDLNILGQILIGGSEKVRESGGILAGGHSINDVDVKYGLSVTGTIHPKRIFQEQWLPGRGQADPDETARRRHCLHSQPGWRGFGRSDGSGGEVDDDTQQVRFGNHPQVPSAWLHGCDWLQFPRPPARDAG